VSPALDVPRASFEQTASAAKSPPAASSAQAELPAESAKTGSALGALLGSVFGVLALSGLLLGVVLWKMPDSNIARTLRGFAGMSPAVVDRSGSDGETVADEPAPGAPSIAADETAADPSDEATAAVAADTAASASAADERAQPPEQADPAAAEADSPEPEEPTEPEAGEADERTPTPAGEIPESVNENRLVYLTRLAVRRAEECHAGGRAVGTAKALLTFQPTGRVSEVRLEGEPVASAPVARCVIARLRAVVVRPFDDPAFTYATEITLK
jgi:hypothetical protein